MADENKALTANAASKEETAGESSLPSLSSVFKPEDFFDLEPLEETALSVMCCYSD